MILNMLNELEFPTLSNAIDWGVVKANFRMSTDFDERLVSNVSIIPFVGDRCVIFQIDNGMWELPGGTLEAGEVYLEALRREVMEELGAVLISYHIFGYFDCESSAATPYKPHIPHPTFTRIVGHGEVKIVGKPLNPADGEQVIAVELVEINEALSRLKNIGRNDIAELYQLAHQTRQGFSG
jgi:8-oxo-dGTP diphosphatase